MCTLFILMCLACTYFVCCSSSTTPEPLPINVSQYITFAVQWKPQFCYKNTAPNCHSESIPNITIHGIWPNSHSGSHPSYCSDTELQTKDVETIREDLDIHWPTLSNSFTNFEFWSYQWRKHGTCWYSINATQYFEHGILWMENEGYKDIQNILVTDGIYASNKNEYSLQYVTNSLNSALNQNCVVRCKNGKYISEFFVCRHWNGEKMDCPHNLLSNCNDNVVLSLQVLPDDTLPPTTATTTATNTPATCDSSMVGVNCEDDNGCPDCMQCCPKFKKCEYPPEAVKAILTNIINKDKPQLPDIGVDPNYIAPAGYDYGYIMLIGVIAFILINNIFIGYWCITRKTNDYKFEKLEMEVIYE